MEYNDLYHHGVKGMKWGQHIFGGIQSRRQAKQRRERLQKAREARAERQKKLKSGKLPVSQMTDKEIKKRLERLNLEQSYNDALRNSKKAEKEFSRGKTFVNKMLNSSMEKVAENAVADVVAQTVKVGIVKGVNKAFGSEQVFTNNKKK